MAFRKEQTAYVRGSHEEREELRQLVTNVGNRNMVHADQVGDTDMYLVMSELIKQFKALVAQSGCRIVPV